MISGVHHLAISTPDIDRMIRFYRDILGFDLTYLGGMDEPNAGTDAMMEQTGVTAELALLRLGTCCLELFQFLSPAARPADPRRPVIDHGITHIGLTVDNIAAEYDRLSRAGMVFHCPPVDTGSAVLCTYGRDPDGNVVELIEVRDVRSPFHPEHKPARQRHSMPAGAVSH